MIDRSMPLCELHRHLDGAVRLQTIIELAEEHGITLPSSDPDALAPYVYIDDREPTLLAFLEKFRYMVEVLVDYDACHRVAYENMQDARAEGLDYVELRFSPWFMAERHGLEPEAVMEACIDGIRAGERDTGVAAGIIGILSRTYGVENCARELDAILAHRDEVVAVDLAGDEAGYPAALFKDHFRRVRDAGLHVTIHAGEADGPHSIWSAIHDLGAERIGHGIRAIEDPKLVEYLAASGIGLEICPTSNLHTTTVESYEAHPARALAEAGVQFCLNTDDPGISHITIEHEYAVAAPAMGLNAAQISDAQRNSLHLAFLSETSKAEIKNRN
ncbi:MAG: adenosine deaminase [Xanthomonadales bacterium]|nr:adenosine deaminase [Xanthomonadales bacterium]